LHLLHRLFACGHARTFWTAWLRARDAGGALVMRMEDLDQERSKPIFAEAALDDLRWLGIRWNEGPDKGGPYAPYVQSKRRAIYLAAWRRLLRSGWLFPCRCSRKDLESALGAPHERSYAGSPEAQSHGKLEPLDDEPIYPGTCRQNLWRAPQLPGPTASDIEVPDGINWRFHVRDGEVVEFNDLNLGRSALWPAVILAILWSGAGMAAQATSLPAWLTTRPCALRKWCAAQTC